MWSPSRSTGSAGWSTAWRVASGEWRVASEDGSAFSSLATRHCSLFPPSVRVKTNREGRKHHDSRRSRFAGRGRGPGVSRQPRSEPPRTDPPHRRRPVRRGRRASTPPAPPPSANSMSSSAASRKRWARKRRPSSAPTSCSSATPPSSARSAAAIAGKRIDAAAALQQTIDEYKALFSQISDTYIQERMADLRDVVGRILAQLARQEDRPLLDVNEPVILVAPEILPSQAMTFDRMLVAGILTESGGATGHAAILARSLGIPAVSGLHGYPPGQDRRPDRPGRPRGPRPRQPRPRGRGGLPQAAARIRRPVRPARREPRPAAVSPRRRPGGAAGQRQRRRRRRHGRPRRRRRRRPVPHRIPVSDAPVGARRGGAVPPTAPSSRRRRTVP